MIPLLFVSYITLGDLPPPIDPQRFEDFDQAFEDLCKDLSDFSGFPYDFRNLFEYAAKNPLCVAFIVVLLVVMAFRFCPLIFRSFRR